MSDGQWALVNVAVAVVSILGIGAAMLLVERRAKRAIRRDAQQTIERIKRS